MLSVLQCIFTDRWGCTPGCLLLVQYAHGCLNKGSTYIHLIFEHTPSGISKLIILGEKMYKELFCMVGNHPLNLRPYLIVESGTDTRDRILNSEMNVFVALPKASIEY